MNEAEQLMHKTAVFLLLGTMALTGTSVSSIYSEARGESTLQSAGAAGKTVWDGVYTAAQAARGKAEYEANCATCHGNLLGGNRVELLKGNDFMQRWREDNLESLITFLKSSMPPIRSRKPSTSPASEASRHNDVSRSIATIYHD